LLLEKLVEKREGQLVKKEQGLNKLTDEEVQTELKAKNLPTFGTKQERLDRLKKYYGFTDYLFLIIRHYSICWTKH
jgi:hypothetical protein